MKNIIYRGLELASKFGCRYYNVVEGNTISLVENSSASILTLTYTPGSTSWSLSDFLGIPKFGKEQIMEPTGKTRKFEDVIVSINGLRLRKLTSDTHILNIIIVGDSESRVVQTYDYTTIIVSKEDYLNEDFINFLFYSDKLLYLKPVGPKPSCWKINNFPKITIKNSNLNLTSSSTEIYNLRRQYDDYVIREVDYQDQFILELRRILENYGVELVRWNKEETLKKTSYISYQFSQTPSKYHHPNYSDEENSIMSHRIPVDFTLRTPDMVLYFDFKNKYNNVDLITNLCEIRTMDRYGEKWTAAVKWQGITEDFNHVYQSDDNSNFSYQCQFRCELYFYEVLDTKYEFLKDIQLQLDNEG